MAIDLAEMNRPPSRNMRHNVYKPLASAMFGIQAALCFQLIGNPLLSDFVLRVLTVLAIVIAVGHWRFPTLRWLGSAFIVVAIVDTVVEHTWSVFTLLQSLPKGTIPDPQHTMLLPTASRYLLGTKSYQPIIPITIMDSVRGSYLTDSRLQVRQAVAREGGVRGSFRGYVEPPESLPEAEACAILYKQGTALPPEGFTLRGAFELS